ncbi:cbb3-type cytochrome oxidase subunit 3 [Fulvimonas soli]|jgi:cytochrome c oxidase cbb3-type subunit 4|uniref:Cytochrome c oxidase cbb3-type subunit 4 n=1 Tax=Fulvimonas soli TaxID=155197 RepID=A0A316I036_9GAMM|nr:cbb3-type cytochrome c oxidase subunit 3 [Fulvimonas soli]PWK85755.1 cytochrome c oxidase cbb3-type subunit 4 [Fulvimonas soli]TNY25702.1 cytochrome-c oxidase [Fulvimonas soli]
MNPAWGHAAGVITTVLMLVFVGIWVWAWRPRHRRVFERLAQLPMEDAGAAGDGAATARTRTEDGRP